MKRFVGILLSIALTLSLSGCGGNASEPEQPGHFYYYRPDPLYGASDAVITPEVRELADFPDLDAMVNAYVAGPVSRELESPFPRDITVSGWEHTGSVFSIDFSEEFAMLSGLDLTIACACVTQTFLELTGAEQVVITAGDALLDGEAAVTMSGGNLSLLDDSFSRLTYSYTVYYTDPERRYLVGHAISVNPADRENLESYLIEQLFHPPEGAGFRAPLPTGVRLLGVQVEDGLCTVNFSGEFESRSSAIPLNQRLALLSVVNTLTQLEHIDRVEFAVEGDLLLHYGLLSIPEPLQRNENAIGPVRTAVNEFDATLYLANGADQLLLAIPTRIRQTSGVSQAELVLRTLLHFEARNGLRSGIPAETRLNSMTIENGICTLDLSAEFLQAGDRLPTAVRCITASLCALDEITTVQITVDGTIPQGDFSDWFQPQMPDTNWFL